jgi:octaprenyl-diphosphate synthase
VTVSAAVPAVPGLAGYLEDVESLLATTVAAHPGVVAAVGADALAAGGKRLRPTLTFLSAPPDAAHTVPAGAAVELVHMASLVHDDIVDGAHLRRGRAAAWTAHGAAAAKAAGDHLFAAAFALLARSGTHEQVSVLADASLALARGEALQRLQRYDAGTTVEAYVERCGLKTGSLFAGACLLGGGSAAFGRNLGIAFQIVDDVLDCTGETVETGKVPGTDLRDGTPTLPLLLAAREDEVVRRALEGGPLEGALVRVAATDAIPRARAVAVDYAERARASLDGAVRSEELEAVVDVVLERTR